MWHQPPPTFVHCRVAKDAKLNALRILDCQGNGAGADVARRCCRGGSWRVVQCRQRDVNWQAAGRNCCAAHPPTASLLLLRSRRAVSDVLLALDWLKLNAQRPAVVSMSLGGERRQAACAFFLRQPLPCAVVQQAASATLRFLPATCLRPFALPLHHHVLASVPPGAGEVQLQLDEAVRSLTEEGIHVVVAAGNEVGAKAGSTAPTDPGRAEAAWRCTE